MPALVETCGQAIRDKRPLIIGVVNAAKLVKARRNPVLQDSLLEADIVVADGVPVVWAGRLLGQPLPERVAGIDLFHELLGLAEKRRYSVFFLGATDEVLEKALERVRTLYPELEIAGARNGYFAEAESETVAEEIRRSGAELLFVAMTTPKKENFLAQWGPRTGTLVRHGIGGSLDILAGKTRRAPARWQKLGLEWLYRVIQEPRRMWRRYLVTNTEFLLLLAKGIARRIAGRPPMSLPRNHATSVDRRGGRRAAG